MQELTTLTDAVLLRRMAAGDEQAFVTLYRRRQGPVYRFALQMSGCASVAEEVTQEVFLTLIRTAAQYDPARGSVAAYLYGIARHHVLRRLEQDRSLSRWRTRAARTRRFRMALSARTTRWPS